MIQPQVNTKDLIAYYKLWAGLTSTGKVFDYSLNGNLGTLTDTDDPITLVPKYPGFLFDGANDYITISDTATFSAMTKGSWCCWFKTTTSLQMQFIVKFVPGYEWLFALDIAGKVFLALHSENDTDKAITQKTDAAFDDGKWHCAMATWDGQLSVDGIIIYIDGIAVAATPITLGVFTAIADTGASVRIGALGNGTQCFNGSIDNVMIFDAAKTAQEVKGIYEATRWRYNV